MASKEENTICVGDTVLIRKGNHIISFPNVMKGKMVWMEKRKFCIDGAIDQLYGSVFKLNDKNELVKCNRKEAFPSGENVTSIDRDNRGLLDSERNQKLSADEIVAMRQQGIDGEKIVDQLIQNSTTFDEKTEFSKQKYIRKKKKKHIDFIEILKPTTRLIMEMGFNKQKYKLCGLRIDTLSQLLNYTNVRAEANIMVVETLTGIVLGAVSDRLGGHGKIIDLYHGSAPVRDKTFENHQNIFSIPLNRVADLINWKNDGIVPKEFDTEERNPSSSSKLVSSETEQVKMDTGTTSTPDLEKSGIDSESSKSNWKRKQVDPLELQRRREWKLQHIKEGMAFVNENNIDGLIIATKFNPTPIVLNLIDLLTWSRPFTVYCQYQEPLIECYAALKKRGGVVQMFLAETWLREYQVLPQRTHPSVNMSGTSGFILSGIVVEK